MPLLQQFPDQTLQTASTSVPKISIVVPNYNGGKTIAATLQSLIDQDYPQLEIVVVDGGSTDNSVEIIKQFEPHIAWWISEPDQGQANAINKGLAQCTGDIVNWLCSDDLLTEDALHIVGRYFASTPEMDVLVGTGQIVYETEGGRVYLRQSSLKRIGLMPARNAIAQPSCFYRRTLLNRPQPVDESYNYAMDFELWNYFKSRGARWQCIEDVLSIAIQDGANKSSTGGEKVTFELERIYNTYVQEWIPLPFLHRRLRYPLERFLAKHPGKFWLCTVGSIWVTITLILSPFYGFNRVWIMRWKSWV
ncbi:MAG: glycosyltransferase family 2 protein [Cyanobacteria bacterium P01_F01_bin.4]